MESSAQVALACRSWLAEVLRTDGPVPAAPAVPVAELVAAAQAEGVRALVAERLRGLPEDTPLRTAFTVRAGGVAAISMLREAECRRVFALLDEAGVRALLLKGSALAWWLYPAPYLRETADFDLLLESASEAERAAEVLRLHGYAGGVYFGIQAHEATVHRPLAGAVTQDLDLHWRLFNAAVFADVLPNDVLFADAMAIPGFHERARGLSPAHAAIHACLHRVMNLHMGPGDRLKWLYDLHLLSTRLGQHDWEVLSRTCRAQGVATVCLDAFERTEATFHTRFPDPVLATLRSLAECERIDRARLGEWRYMQRLGLARLPTLRARLAWFGRQMFPSLDYLRSFYGDDLAWWQLIIERVRRLGWRIR